MLLLKGQNPSQPNLTLVVYDPKYEIWITSQKENQNKLQSSRPNKSMSMMKMKKKSIFKKELKKT